MLKGDFYTIISSVSKDTTSFSSVLDINKAHSIFKGHFPALPIVPGVCMMQIIKEQLEDNLQKKVKLQSASNIKFLSLINPAENTEIEVDIKFTTTEEGTYLTDGVISVKGAPYFKLVKAIYK